MKWNRWRGLGEAILGLLGLTLPAMAQSGLELPTRPAPIFTTAAALGPDGRVLPPNLGPALPDVSTPRAVASSDSSKDPATGAWLVEGDFLMFAPRRSGQEFAIVGTNPNFGPIGVVKAVDGNYDSGFRIGAGYRFADEGVEVMGRYTFFHTAASLGVTRPDGEVLFATATNPGGNVVQVNSAHATSSINLNVFDMEVGKRFDISESMTGRLFAGPRFAGLDQKFQATYQGRDVSRDDVQRRVFFDGGGVRAGGEVQWKFFDHLGTYFRGSASMLTGRFRGDLSEIANGATIVSVSEHFTRVVPVLEMGLGIQYQNGPFRLTVGYEFNTWFDMVQGLDFVNDTNPAKIGSKTGNIGLDGIVFRSELVF